MINIKSIGWTRKLEADYIVKPKKKYYERKTDRKYKDRSNMSIEEKHIRTRLSVAKKRAMDRNLEWDIEYEDLEIPKTCPYLGIPITYVSGHGRVQSNISIDRKDSSKGYVKSNVELISDLANRMKQEATPEQLLCFAHGILTHLDKLKK